MCYLLGICSADRMGSIRVFARIPYDWLGLIRSDTLPIHSEPIRMDCRPFQVDVRLTNEFTEWFVRPMLFVRVLFFIVGMVFAEQSVCR